MKYLGTKSDGESFVTKEQLPFEVGSGGSAVFGRLVIKSAQPADGSGAKSAVLYCGTDGVLHVVDALGDRVVGG